ncbi:MAG: hypothetical protein ACYDD0_01900 [Candidatus Dormibacteria bacterium]
MLPTSSPESSRSQELEAAAPPSAARRLELDGGHTMVLYPQVAVDRAQPSQDAAGGGGVLGDRGPVILLFRAGGDNGADVPDLWLEAAGSIWPAELLLATGWGQGRGPAVALMTVPGGWGASATGTGPVMIHLRAGHLELASPLPEMWREELRVGVAG